MSEKPRRRTRWRATLVPVPLLVGLAAAGSVGARMLFEQPPDRSGYVTCWDSERADPPDCSVPTGAAGLSQVFPLLDREAPGCRETQAGDPAAERALQWTCRIRFEGSLVRIVYSERTDLDRGIAAMEAAYPGVATTVLKDGDLLQWKPAQPTPAGRWLIGVAYAEYPFTLQLDAATSAGRDRALRQLVQFREVELFRTQVERRAG